MCACAPGLSCARLLKGILLELVAHIRPSLVEPPPATWCDSLRLSAFYVICVGLWCLDECVCVPPCPVMRALVEACLCASLPCSPAGEPVQRRLRCLRLSQRSGPPRLGSG